MTHIQKFQRRTKMKHVKLLFVITFSKIIFPILYSKSHKKLTLQINPWKISLFQFNFDTLWLILLCFDILLHHFYFWLSIPLLKVKSSCIRLPPLFGIDFGASKGGLICGILQYFTKIQNLYPNFGSTWKPCTIFFEKKRNKWYQSNTESIHYISSMYILHQNFLRNCLPCAVKSKM